MPTWLKYAAIAVMAAATSAAVMAATGEAGRAAKTTTAGKNYTLKPGSFVRFVGMDFQCDYEASDADHHDPGPALFCSRYSTASTPTGTSRAIGVSNYHYRVSNPSGAYWISIFNRSP